VRALVYYIKLGYAQRDVLIKLGYAQRDVLSKPKPQKPKERL
jgi:hypothetical protein